MVFKSLSVPVLWTEVASALEGLKISSFSFLACIVLVLCLCSGDMLDLNLLHQIAKLAFGKVAHPKFHHKSFELQKKKVDCTSPGYIFI